MLEKRSGRIYWISFLVLSAVLMVCFYYRDLMITTRHAINFWDILFKGRILYFYQDNICASGNQYMFTEPGGCSYNILVYLVFAVWDFPLWLLEKANVDVMNNIPCLLWAKLLPVGAVLLSTRYLGKVLETASVPEKRVSFAKYLYLTSSLLIGTVLITSRYDAMCSVFMLLSLFFWLKKKNGWFAFWCGIAFCFNYFAVLIFAPLLLLREKNFWKILRGAVFMVIPYGITMGLFIAHPLPNKVGFTEDLFKMLFSNTNGRFSWFIVAYCGILLYAYLTDEHTDSPGKPLWLCCFSMASLFAFCSPYPYWPILLSPFLAMVLGASDPKRDHLNLVIETVTLASLLLENMVKFFWCFVDGTMHPMLLSVLMPDRVFKAHQVLDIWIKISKKVTIPLILHSVFIAGLLVLAYIHFPGRKDRGDRISSLVREKDAKGILCLRWVTTVIMCLLPFLTLIK